MTLVRHYAKRSKTLGPAERAAMISVLGTLRGAAAQCADPVPDCNSISQKWDQLLEAWATVLILVQRVKSTNYNIREQRFDLINILASISQILNRRITTSGKNL